MAVACAARQTPAPIEYLPRKAGLGQEESMPSSGRLNFMSQLTTELRHSRRPGAWPKSATLYYSRHRKALLGGCCLQRLVRHGRPLSHHLTRTLAHSPNSCKYAELASGSEISQKQTKETKNGMSLRSLRWLLLRFRNEARSPSNDGAETPPAVTHRQQAE